MKVTLITIAAAFLASVTVSAQTFVSTTPENKNAVLEEFSGIHCSGCPYGHLTAKQIKTSNPNDVVLINIQSDFFATPNPGEPDFRTTFGETIDNQAQLQYYPGGTVNRRNFPGSEQTDFNTNMPVSGILAMGSDKWAQSVSTVLGESSPVNIAAQASLNLQTRVLEVIVETYFTAAGGTAPYKINVALMQNNIEGPQSGASWNPSAVLPNGNYNHQHILRHLLTGQWGADVTSTTMGYFQKDTFTYTVPATIAYGTSPGIPVNLQDLEVAVYLAEGQTNIITGNMATMNLSGQITPIDKIRTINAIKIAPNPARDHMTLQFETSKATQAAISIINTLGQKVYNVKNDTFDGLIHLKINTSELTPGLYFLNITTAEGSATKRFIVQE